VDFQIGDAVRAGTCVGTVTDVGTVLIQMKTSEGRSRVVCPWELVKLRRPREGAAARPRRRAITM
jgi:hypothetical protein